ncbi:MAG: ATP synthase F1 subunit gamma [Bacilli bacterium]|nr:ATP synthase F1 subunit gamma [Bacilli bacterium]
MSVGLNKTKHRIESIKSTQKITKAMGMVATVKLKRFRDAKTKNALYEQEVANAMAFALANGDSSASHYAMESEKEGLGTLYIVISSNLGLCAGYNSNVFKFVESIFKEGDKLAFIGEKAKTHFSHDPRFENSIEPFFEEYGTDLNADEVSKSVYKLKDAYNAEKFKRIEIVYTKYVNSLTFEPAIYTLLPLSLVRKENENESYCPPLLEPGPREMVHALMPQYLSSALNAKYIESQLSEQASRSRAMDTANDNADELIRKLTIEYNKARQGAITQQITEVVSGSTAAK